MLNSRTIAASFIAVVVAASPVLADDINSVVGSTPGFSGDGGDALLAQINDPHGIAVAPDGTIYFADSGNFRIRKVDPSGVISTIAGNGATGTTGDGGPAIDATLPFLLAIALDPVTNALYVADVDRNRVRRIDLSTGIITAFAGTGTAGFQGDGGSATAARLRRPQGVSVAPDGSVLIADTSNCRIRRVSGGIITTIAGTTICDSTGNGLPATAATFYFPRRVNVDSDGNIFIVDGNILSTDDDTVRRIDAVTGVIDVVAGGGSTVPGFGPATEMDLGNVSDVVTDELGNLYIGALNRVFRVDLASGFLSAFAGNANDNFGFSGDGGNALAAEFNNVNAIAFEGEALLIADGGNARIRAVTPTPPPVNNDLFVDFVTNSEMADILSSITSVTDSVFIVNMGGQTFLVIPNLQTIGLDFNAVDNANSDVVVINLTTLDSVGGAINITGNLSLTHVLMPDLIAAGSINIEGNPAITVIELGNVTSVTGDLTLIGTAASVINLAKLTSVSGNLDISGNNITGADGASGDLDLSGLIDVAGTVNISGNTAAGDLLLGSLDNTGGSVNISNNTVSGVLDLALLATVSGDLTVSENSAAGDLDLGQLTSADNVAVNGNTVSGVIDIGSLTSADSVQVSGNTAAGVLDLGSLGTVSGDLTVTENGDATVNLAGLTSVGGDLTLDTTGSGNLDLSGADVSGDLDLETVGYGGVSGNTAGGDTTFTAITSDAILRLALRAASFETSVTYSFTHLDPLALSPETGTAANGDPAIIDPVVGYQFTFATPVLNSPATLSFDVKLAGLDAASQTQMLDALAAGNVTMVTKPDGSGATYQAFALCGSGEVPVPDGCVNVELLDADGNPTSGTPAIVRFSNVVGHFSTWAVAVVTTIEEVCPVLSTDLCSDLRGHTTVYGETLTRNPDETLVVDRTFDATAGSATVVVHNNGCADARVTLNGNEVISLGEIGGEGACFTRTVALESSNAVNIVLPTTVSAARAGGGSVTICHSTGSEFNPYVEITVSASALAAHARHHDGNDIIPAPADGCPGGPVQPGGEGEGEGEGEPGGEGEGEGEGEPGGEGEGEPGGEGEGEGDVGCTITVTVVEPTPCGPDVGPLSTGTNTIFGFSCANSGAQTPVAFGALALLLALRRRRR